MRLPGIARTLRAIAREGRDAFYGGEFGRGLLELGNGHYAAEDLATGAARWCEPLRLRVWGHDLWTVPPPSQGYLTLAGAYVAEAAGLGDGSRRPALGTPPRRVVARRRPRPARGTLRRRRRCRAPRHRPPRRRRRARAGRRGGAPGRRARPGRGRPGGRPDRRRRHDTPVRHGRGRSRGLADPVQRPRLRLPPHRSDDGRVPPQPRRGLLARPRAIRPRWDRDGDRPTPSPPCWRLAPTVRSRISSAPWAATRNPRSSGSSWPACCTQVRTPRPRWPRPGSRSTHRRPVRSACGGATTSRWSSSRTRHRPWLEGLPERGHRVQRIRSFDPVAVGCAQIIAVRSDGGARRLVGASDPRSPEGAAIGR